MDLSQRSSKGAKGKDIKNKRKKGNKSSSSEEETSTTPNTSLFAYLKIKKEKCSSNEEEEEATTSTRPPKKTSIFGFKKGGIREGTKYIKTPIKIEGKKPPKFVDPAEGRSQFYSPLKEIKCEKQSPEPESKNKHIKKTKKKSRTTTTNSEWYVADREQQQQQQQQQPSTSYDSLSREIFYQPPLSAAYAPIAYNEILTYKNEGKKKKNGKKNFSRQSTSSTTLSENISSDLQKPIIPEIKVRFSFPAKTQKEYEPSPSSSLSNIFDSTSLPPPPSYSALTEAYEEREALLKESFEKKKKPSKITMRRMQTSTPLRSRIALSSSSSSSSPSPPPSSSNRSALLPPLQEPPPLYQGCRHGKFHELYEKLINAPPKYEGYESVSSSVSSLISEDNEIRSMSPDKLKKNVDRLLANIIYKKMNIDEDDDDA